MTRTRMTGEHVFAMARHATRALEAQDGACNPVALAKELHEQLVWVSQCNAGGVRGVPQQREYAPAALLCHQLAHLFGFGADVDVKAYDDWTKECAQLIRKDGLVRSRRFDGVPE